MNEAPPGPEDLTRSSRDSLDRSLRSSNPILVLMTGFLAALLLGACVLCGGAIWWFRPQIEHDAARTEQMLKEIVQIQIPDTAYQPAGTIEWNVAFTMNVRGVYYERFIGDGLLMIVEVSSPFREDQDVQRHIRDTLLEKGSGGTPLLVDDAETKRMLFPVGGDDIPFTFEIGRDPPSGRVFRMVEGVFAGKSGEVLLALRVDEDHWDEQSVVAMLQSLGDQPREEEESAEPTEGEAPAEIVD